LFLVVMLAVLAICCIAAWWTEQRRPSNWIPDPPDDPRLRNYLSERHWRLKRALIKGRWTA